MCPPRWTRVSELLHPPQMGRSLMSATFMPMRAAATEAQMPAMPPPTTTKSYSTRRMRLLSYRWRKVSNAPASVGGMSSLSVVNQRASQRPSKPVRSCRQTSASLSTVAVPAYCHIQRFPVCPIVCCKGLPSMLRVNLPGPSCPDQGEVQLNVRT